jgi:hypothetical protein
MKTIAKNAIFKMVEAMNDSSIYEYSIEDIRKTTKDDKTVDWSFSVFQVKHIEGESMQYKELISDPMQIISAARAMDVGFYISVDTIGTKPEDYDGAKLVTWGKPHIRLY